MSYSCSEFSVSPQSTSDCKKDFSGTFFVFDSSRPLDELENIISSPLTGTYLGENHLGVEADDSVFAADSNVIPTPPPEICSTRGSVSPASLSHYSAASNASEYMKGSSLEQSPISSPEQSSICADDLFIVPTSSKTSFSSSTRGSLSDSLKDECLPFLQLQDPEEEDVRSIPDIHAQELTGELANENVGRGQEIGLEKMKTAQVKDECSASQPNTPKPLLDAIPRNIKLPQRKGGMQLWQFLYALLGDSAVNKYGKLIEWTANRNSREFRLLEPEAIAIWWGEHKNKKNMSYDKLSRSLRYYYDKGIIRKIPGERYVYQFCIDPEMMYKHIGNSDCRPKLKPMPFAAVRATSDYQLQHGYSTSLFSKEPFYGPIMMHSGMSGSYPLGSSEIPFPPPDYPGHAVFPSSNFFDSAFAPVGADMYGSAPMTPPHATGLEFHQQDNTDIKPLLPIRKCHSYDAGCVYANESDDVFRQSYASACGFPGSMPSMYPFPPPPLQSISPSQSSSRGTSPLVSTFSQRGQLLDELIEPASCDMHSANQGSVYSTPEDNTPSYASNDSPVVWNFN